MKQRLKIIVMAMALGLVCMTGQAQGEGAARPPKWVSEKGFWVVESTVKNPAQSTIYFYSNAGELVYKEGVTGKLKLHKRKTLMHIKSVLETAIAASDSKQPLSQNEKFFAGTRWQ